MVYDQEDISILRTELANLLNCLDNIAAASEVDPRREDQQLKDLQEKNRNLRKELSQIKSDLVKADQLKEELLRSKSDHASLLHSLECFKTEKEILVEENQKLAADNEGTNFVLVVVVVVVVLFSLYSQTFVNGNLRITAT